jgi:hypothetical protein
MIANQIAGFLGVASAVAATDYESIATVTVGGGGAATVSFTSIAGTYKHLQIRSIQRNTTSGLGTQIGLVQFNSDTGANYSRHNLIGNGSSAVSNAVTSTTAIVMGVMPQAGDTANAFGASVMDILDYSNTSKYKTTRTLEGLDTNGGGEANFRSGLWQSTSAITSIVITPTSNNFAQYTTFALYGIK